MVGNTDDRLHVLKIIIIAFSGCVAAHASLYVITPDDDLVSRLYWPVMFDTNAIHLYATISCLVLDKESLGSTDNFRMIGCNLPAAQLDKIITGLADSAFGNRAMKVLHVRLCHH